MKIGLLGYGFMGGAHLAALASLPDVTVAALATRTRPSGDAPARGNLQLKSAALPPTVPWYADWRDVVRDPALDAVDICLPTALHKDAILSAFAHGKHVLCEKPMALTPRDCDEILEAAARADRIFIVAQVLRWTFPYRYALDVVRTMRGGGQEIRRCVLSRATGLPGWSGWLADPAQSGGAILDLLSHDLDQALCWFGTPQRVSAISLGPVDTARATLGYPHGPSVIVEGGWLPATTPFSQHFVLEGPGTALEFRDGCLRHSRSGASATIALPAQDPYAEEIAYFVDCCRKGEQPVLCPPAASADAVRLATLVRDSRDRGGETIAWEGAAWS